jgi:hypothetical protein
MSEATTFEGRTSAMRTSPWLASEDLDGLGEVPVTIESVFQHKDAIMQDGRKQPKLFAVKFEGKDRQLVLNATNRKTLAAAFGSDCRAWKGKKILLYVKDGVRNPAGGTTKGIRIK